MILSRERSRVPGPVLQSRCGGTRWLRLRGDAEERRRRRQTGKCRCGTPGWAVPLAAGFRRLPSISKKAKIVLWEEVLRLVPCVGAVPSAAEGRGKAFGITTHGLLSDYSSGIRVFPCAAVIQPLGFFFLTCI